MHLSSIVLAGGKSSRMGRDKALIPIQGVPLLQLVCRIAESCADTLYVVTPWQERYQRLLPSTVQFIKEVPLFGETGSEKLPHGPIIGFAQALAYIQTDWVLLLACDLPKLRVEVLQEWAATLDSVEGEAIAALVPQAKGWEPLCGFYRRRCLPSLVEYINQGGRSFQEWLKQHPVQALPLPDPEMFFNCNTQEDLFRLQSQVQ
ncbi:molybdenum cofactor guanylyltransferase [Brasilonema octagenarum UFV-E1]|uniref:Probable molybdenum cofactor guanylyltransferase n=1 Tax=Brasilonema sennae CENA114 TaxID=415709 RepID=A0A856M7Y3_9CYAN|nr:molybdenum cofactor guanylyltransferase [Brasilonema sennae]QDL07255.1 molybdenum cofactor guanylyltransferase [Brasilonema sennae CENA114]QDL13618.1 molybdenum cofactor guanylyltransferase [Brasilonema octagenarum UFV-E1]